MIHHEKRIEKFRSIDFVFRSTLLIRSMWFIIVTSERFLSSETFRLIDGLIPQWGWAIACLIASVNLFMVLMCKTQAQIWMVFAGSLAATIYMLLAVAT
ncbi:hypothetical protein [Alkalicoccobacillus gibsonii]|uniref:hypothetical protein n=1 Tax=Alkalicoccobacillus gibsonii TaxID=79881 RepID=UPI003517F96A